MVDRPLEGRRVLITGGAGGVGRETAARMIEQGARVVSADVASATRHAEGVVVCSGDLSRAEEIDRLFRFVDSQFGGLDVLVA
jgi:NAD(P)-dependent dehydrogenase (short-subunit alcohol dehydrogenase family)